MQNPAEAGPGDGAQTLTVKKDTLPPGPDRTQTVKAEPPSKTEPVLRTLSPMLRKLETRLREWLQGKHLYPLSLTTSSTLEGLANDLHRQADALDIERPYLVVMLVGGTGVGKSTLLNALAGGAIAYASFARPTTRDPVVYYHESMKPEKFDLLLRNCHLQTHDRPALQYKILVDTPDLDSTDLANREKTMAIMPVADVVIWVGSQEKYHDADEWRLFLEHRRRKASAFVMNKWDRCVHVGAEGLRPDDDLLKDLKEQGFSNPILFRTNAQYHVDKANGEATGTEPPAGEQFYDLVNWLEMGLNRMEIDAIKARGISQLLEQLERSLQEAAPPNLADIASRTRTAWEKTLGEEAAATAEVLLNALQPYQDDIEHHFTIQSQKRFRGPMGFYLGIFNKLKYFGSSLGSRFSFLPKASSVQPQGGWNLTEFTRSLSSVAGERQLDARSKALADRLLVQADEYGFPLTLLTDRTEAAARADWRQRNAQALVEVLEEVESQWSRPKGFRRLLHNLVILAGNLLPVLVFFGTAGLILWQLFMNGRIPGLFDLLVPVGAVFLAVILLHILILVVLPLRWTRIRGEFQGLLDTRLRAYLVQTYAAIPGELSEALLSERQRVEKLVENVREVASWLEQRQQAASITSLYGN
jgi:energy-coupling factor transporter ATP-binding protein EcfA2